MLSIRRFGALRTWYVCAYVDVCVPLCVHVRVLVTVCSCEYVDVCVCEYAHV